ncbi:helix-turn-helix transcriptional regulator [Micrococcus sp. TA1]|uniref:ArsR/SmtB family transcription factor n=1 Tax=Micrococcus sp. TA1 TaxID=681627 RepID=UPI00184F485C|nr:metalloregulator ArsR/SmtB family transcription factor [Micrococcus sp. TA1]MBB5749233.1 ArsR family transcriptional regulator [Micrococcus sp. TA1]
MVATTTLPALETTGRRAEASGTPESVACCSLSDGPISAEQAQRAAGMLKALADPMRLRLLSHVAAQGCEAVCSCDLTEELGISQPTVSHHMKKLVDAGLLIREQRGRWAHYTVVPAAFAELRRMLEMG